MNKAMKNINKILSLYVILSMILLVGCLEQDVNIEESDFQDFFQDFEEVSKVEKITGIAHQYHKTHTYIDNDVFDCDNMAQDMWNILKTEGFNSKIVLGNTEHIGDLTIEDCDHVWLLVKVSSNEWLAVETTNGEVIYKENNEHYYKGFFFDNPKNYRNFVNLYEDYNYQYAEYESEKDYYNYLVGIYNDANYYEQIQLRSALDVTKNNLEIKERRVTETGIKIEAILEYG